MGKVLFPSWFKSPEVFRRSCISVLWQNALIEKGSASAKFWLTPPRLQNSHGFSNSEINTIMDRFCIILQGR